MSDAVVIGAGPNGLAAAIRLAEAGRSVLVLEAADAPGGAVRTQELTLPGFLHDTFSSVYPASVASPVFARMPLRHGSSGCTRTPATRTRCPAARRRCCTATAPRCPAATASAGPSSARRSWSASTALRDTMLSGFPPIGGPLRLGPEAAGRDGADAARLGGRASASGCSSTAPRAPGSTAPRCTATRRRTAPARRSPRFYLNVLGHAVGWPSPRGGAERLTDALVSYLRSLGGEIRTGARVERVLSAARPGDRRRDRRRALRRRTIVDRRRDAGGAADAWPTCPPGTRTALKTYARGRGDGEGRLGARRPDPVGEPGRPRRRNRPRGRHRGGVPALGEAGPRRPRRPAVPAARPAERRRPDPRARGQAHGLGVHARAAGRAVDATAIVERIEARSSASRPASATASSPATCSCPADLEARNANLVGGDVGGGSLPAAPGRLPPAPEALAVLHAAQGPLHRQRGDVPGRRRPRRARATRPRARRWQPKGRLSA